MAASRRPARAIADVEGKFYFADVAAGSSINKIDLDGRVSVHIAGTPRISGMEFGPDGRLYACTQAPKKQIVSFDTNGGMTVLADHVQPNDLVVSCKGNTYFTETGKHQVTLIDSNGRLRVVYEGITAPNGISFSLDQETLAVSDYRSTNVWAFKMESDGSLSGAEPYMMLRPPSNNQKVAKGNGNPQYPTGSCDHRGGQIRKPATSKCRSNPKTSRSFF